jgi:hypothetical protein
MSSGGQTSGIPLNWNQGNTTERRMRIDEIDCDGIEPIVNRFVDEDQAEWKG